MTQIFRSVSELFAVCLAAAGVCVCVFGCALYTHLCCVVFKSTVGVCFTYINVVPWSLWLYILLIGITLH